MQYVGQRKSRQLCTAGDAEVSCFAGGEESSSATTGAFIPGERKAKVRQAALFTLFDQYCPLQTHCCLKSDFLQHSTP